jgi:NADPH-dependent curcumin reductase CurA
MSVPSHADVIVLNRRPGPALRPGDLVPERRPLRPPGPGEVVVRNLVTSVDPYQLRMLRGSSEVTPVGVGEPVPADSVGTVVRSEDPGAYPSEIRTTRLPIKGEPRSKTVARASGMPRSG